MNAFVNPVTPLASAIADLIISVQAATRRFLNSEKVPTWTEYLGGCNK